MNNRDLMQALIKIAEAAGQEIMAIYRDESRWQVQKKDDSSPLTAADIASNTVIVSHLEKLTPDIPIISEECDEISFQERRQWTQCWLVDPLDGTKEFIARNDEFSVNIALVKNNQAVLGIIYSPVTGVSYVAAKGEGAYKVENNKIKNIAIKNGKVENEEVGNGEVDGEKMSSIMATPLNSKNVRVVTSRRHKGRRDETFIAETQKKFESVNVVPAGSAFKICRIAEGGADVYPRFGHTMEWDTAAGQIIVEEAGGAIVDKKGRPFRYNQRETLRNDSFMVVGGQLDTWLPVWQLAEKS